MLGVYEQQKHGQCFIFRIHVQLITNLKVKFFINNLYLQNKSTILHSKSSAISYTNFIYQFHIPVQLEIIRFKTAISAKKWPPASHDDTTEGESLTHGSETPIHISWSKLFLNLCVDSI